MSRTRAPLPLLVTLISACATPAAAPGSPAPVAPRTEVPAPAAPSAAGTPSAAPPPVAPAPVPADPAEALDRAADAYIAAANAGDRAAQQGASSDACWEKECGNFARQAGNKFHVERSGSIRRLETHAQLILDAICDEQRKCDRVYVLLELDRTFRWLVTDVTEDGKKADAWVLPAGYTEPRMPPTQPPGAPAAPPGETHPPAGLKQSDALVDVDLSGLQPSDARVFAMMRGSFRHCYWLGLSGDPDARGTLVLEIDVGPDGQVEKADARSKSGTLPTSVTTCVEARARAAAFPQPDGGSVHLRVPLAFSRRGKKTR